MTDRYCLRISNGVLKNSSDVFNILDPDIGGSSTFRVAVEEIANPGVLAYWAAYTPLEPATLNALLVMNNTQFQAYVDELAIIRERTPVGSILAFKSSVVISAANANPWAFLASLGCQVMTFPE